MDLRVNGVESVLSSCYPRVFLYQCAFLNLGGGSKITFVVEGAGTS